MLTTSPNPVAPIIQQHIIHSFQWRKITSAIWNGFSTFTAKNPELDTERVHYATNEPPWEGEQEWAALGEAPTGQVHRTGLVGPGSPGGRGTPLAWTHASQTSLDTAQRGGRTPQGSINDSYLSQTARYPVSWVVLDDRVGPSPNLSWAHSVPQHANQII